MDRRRRNNRNDRNSHRTDADLAPLLRDALTHLSDVVYLQSHPLARRLAEAAESSSVQHRGRALRDLLVDAIGRLEPPSVAGGVHAARAHRLLRLRYLQAVEPHVIQRTLGISRSQYFADLRRGVAALASLVAPQLSFAEKGDLPLPLTSFVGREREVVALSEALSDALGLSRPEASEARTPRGLITVTGAAGSGKTRLALETAALLQARADLRVFFVDLAPLRDPALVLPAIARCLDILDGPDERLITAIAERTQDRPSLILLDTFEHLLGAASVLPRLLRRCSRVALLVTSRTPLGLAGEREFQVGPLAVPAEDGTPDPEELGRSPAVALFVDRASAVRPGLELTRDNAADIAEICRRLDGLPLAIELAAARSRILSPAAMRLRLDRTLALLTSGARDLPPRHRTLRAAIEWSVDLLDGAERAFLGHLAVFSGGWTLEAAEAVAGRGARSAGGASDPALHPPDTLDALESLVAKGLVRQRMGEADGTAQRFTLLDTIRQFASELLERSGEAHALRDRHAAFFAALVEDAERELRRADARGAWLDRVEEEHDNLRAALDWLERSGDAEAGLRLAYNLSFLWWLRGYAGEGRSWMARFLALPEERSSGDTRASVLVAAGVFARHQRDYTAARRLLEAALATPCARQPTAHQARAAYWLSVVDLDEGNHAGAQDHATASLAFARDVGDASATVRALNGLGEVARAVGQPEKAQALYSEALALLRERDDSGLLVMTLCNLAGASVALGDRDKAAALLKEVLSLESRFRSKRNVAVCLSALTGLAVACAAPQDGAQLAGATDALLEQTAGFLDVTDRAQYERSVAEIRGQLTANAYSAAYERGAAMKLDEALAFALEVLADWSEGAAGQQR